MRLPCTVPPRNRSLNHLSSSRLFQFQMLFAFGIVGFVTLTSQLDSCFATESPSVIPVSYQKDVFPILRANCLGCHQESRKQGGYLMTDFGQMMAGGETESAAVVPGKADESYLVKLITPVDGKSEMPKNGKQLKSSEIDIIVRWINEGAKNDLPARAPQFSELNPPKYVRPPVVSGIDFSRDGEFIAVTGVHETLVYKTSDWVLHKRLIGYSPRVESIKYSPDGKYLAVAGGEPGVSGELQIWSVSDGSLMRSQFVGNDTVYGVQWSPDSKLLSFALSDNSVRAVDVESGEQKLYQRAHEDWPRTTVFSVDGKHLVSAGRDMTVKLTEVETERFIDNITSITPGALRGGVHSIARHPTRDEILVGGSDGTPRIYRMFRQTARVIGDDANLVRQLESLPGRIFSVAISEDGKYLAVASTIDRKSTLRVWSYDVDSALPADIKAIQAKRAADRKPDEKKKLEEYTTAQPAMVAQWDIPDAAIYAIALDSRGRIAASGSDGKLRVWKLDDKSSIADIPVVPQNQAANDDPQQIEEYAAKRVGRLQEIAETQKKELGQLERPTLDVKSIVKINIEPAEITFSHWNDSIQMLVTGATSDGRMIDLSDRAEYSLSDTSTAWVSPRGWLQPLAKGTAKLSVRFGEIVNTLEVKSEFENTNEVDFVRDVNPILSRLGCNQGTCHGAQAGKGGFKLSLRGYDPIFDLRALTDDLAGRRYNPAAPLESLMMTKPLGLVAHTGGKLISEGDIHANVLREWIASGASLNLSSPKVAKIQLSPQNPIVQEAGELQQVRVIATYVDGKTRDVTREAHLESGNTEVATIIEGQRATSIRRGEAPLLARYEGAYAATTLTVMGKRDGFQQPAAVAASEIDRLVNEKWERMKIAPSPLCTDTEFLRRVYLDLTGLPPTSDQVREFLKDTTPSEEKRNRIIDSLISSESFVDHWTNKWSDLLQVNSKFLGKPGAESFRDWIRKSIAANKPYNEFVKEIVTASGSNRENPPASYYKILRTPEDTVENTTHLFLGIRFNCNKCHDHPFERWTQDQYYQTAAYFAQVGLKKDEESKDKTIGGTAVEGAKPLYEIVSDTNSGEVKHQRTNSVVTPEFPFQCDYEKVDGASRRAEFGAWLTSPSNPYFARSYVNRMWGYLLGKGLIEPIDDIRAGNPASIPEVLNYLEKEFVASKFDARQLMRTICRSRVYQLSFETNDWNADDNRNYSHAMPRRLPAEVLYDAIHQVTGTPTRIPGVKQGTRAASLADADAGLPDGFLNNLGRPARESACECERSSELRLGSVMALVSGPTLGTAIADKENSIRKLVQNVADDRELVQELFMRVLSRPATSDEVDASWKVFEQIKQDHESLLGELNQREDWWKVQKPIREEAQKKELADTVQALTDREEAVKPERQRMALDREMRIAASQQKVTEYESTLPTKINEYIALNVNQNPVWQTTAFVSGESTNKANFFPQSDRSIRVRGDAGKGVYTVRTAVQPETTFNRIRFEALPLDDLPAKGPGLSENGNFVITELELFVGNPADAASMKQIKFKRGVTDFNQSSFSAAALFDGKRDDQGGWAIHGAAGMEHWAVLETEAVVEVKQGDVLQWKVHQQHNAQDHRIGRFRMSASKVDGDLKLGLSESLAAVAAIPVDQRSSEILKEPVGYLSATSNELKMLREQLAKDSAALPEDEQIVSLKKRIEKLKLPIVDDAKLVRLREDATQSKSQLDQLRVTAAEDITWALINSPAFLFNY